MVVVQTPRGSGLTFRPGSTRRISAVVSATERSDRVGVRVSIVSPELVRVQAQRFARLRAAVRQQPSFGLVHDCHGSLRAPADVAAGDVRFSMRPRRRATNRSGSRPPSDSAREPRHFEAGPRCSPSGHRRRRDLHDKRRVDHGTDRLAILSPTHRTAPAPWLQRSRSQRATGTCPNHADARAPRAA